MNKKGFTIIELLVAFVILFILMTGFLSGDTALHGISNKQRAKGQGERNLPS
jgi:prepilin-type N-terminal cleavage/methylation domain